MDPSVANPIETIASYGAIGAVAVVSLWFAIKKDREASDERQGRIDDAKGYTKMALDLQEKVLTAVNKLSDILEETKKITPR